MSEHDDLVSFVDDAPASSPDPARPAHPAVPPWKVLVVDDDRDVHESTVYALRGLDIADRPVLLLHAHSAIEALHLLRHESDIAVILLDVVMETEHAGLELVDRIRIELGMGAVRIILRTGQPGQAPELETIRRYDINDYKTKSDLTRSKLYATLTAAVRSYDQLRRLEATRQGLEKVIAASNHFIAEQGLVSFAEGVILQIAGVLGIKPEGLVCACVDNRPGALPLPADAAARPALPDADPAYIVIAAAGRYGHLIRHRVAEIDDALIVDSLRRCLDGRCNVFQDGRLTLFFAGRGMRDFAAYIASAAPLSEVDRHLLEVFCTNITLCAANVSLVSRLRELAYVDALTALPNRAATIEHLDAQIATAALAGQVLATIDLDQFAETNDVFGHRFGDQLLQAVARRLHAALADRCHVARVAGNTFAVFGPAEAVNPQALHDLLDPPLVVDTHARRLSVSMAFVACDEIGAPSGSELLKDAAIAMKRAKSGGQGRSAFYTQAIGADSKERTRLLHGLHRAFDHDRLFLMYQPKVDLASGELAGVEALMRWRAEDGRLVPPDRFIPVAEQSGLIVALGQWALRASLDDLALLRRAGHDRLQMAVNVSAVQFAHPEFQRQVEQALADKQVPAGALELEVTESVAAIGLERVSGLLRALRARGVGVAIDDFGTGYSSLSYLDQLPADRLKIDRAFIELLDTDRPGARIARMIVPLGHQLGMKVLAEGVETAAQAQMLRDIGCDQVQGYAVARPMPLAELQTWLSAYRPHPLGMPA